MRWLYATITGVMWLAIITETWDDRFLSAPIAAKAVTLGVVAIATIVFLDAIKELRQR